MAVSPGFSSTPSRMLTVIHPDRIPRIGYRVRTRRRARLAESGPSAQSVEEGEDDRAYRHDENRGQDQQDERKDDLRRSLLSSLLGRLAPPLSHIDGQIAQNLADRHAEHLALDNRLHEDSERGTIRPREHVRQRLLNRQPHALFTQRNAKLLAERPLNAPGGGLERRSKTDA